MSRVLRPDTHRSCCRYLLLVMTARMQARAEGTREGRLHGVTVPDCLAATVPADGRGTTRSINRRRIGVKVHLSRLCRFMTEPQSDHGEIHAPTQQSHGRGVTKRVRCHGLGGERRTGSTCAGEMPQNESLQCICAQAPAVGTREDRSSGLPPCPDNPPFRTAATSGRSGVHLILRPFPTHLTCAPTPSSTS